MIEEKDVEFGIVMPKWDNSGQKLNTQKHKKTIKDISERFGGATVFPSVLGCWKEDGELMCEENMIVTSVRTKDSDKDADEFKKQVKEDTQFVRNEAEEVGEDLGQAAIMKTKDKTSVSFVEGEWKDEAPSTHTKGADGKPFEWII